MDLPQKVEAAITAAVVQVLSEESSALVGPLNIETDGNFKHDGLSGNELLSVRVSCEVNGDSRSIQIIAKKWESASWVTLLMGIRRPVELLLCEGGAFLDINALGCLRVPIIHATRSADDAWIIMKDVKKDLDSWKKLTSDPSDLTGEYLLMDQLAAFHVKWQEHRFQERLMRMRSQLVPQERRIRWFESLNREWIGGRGPDPKEPPELRAVKESISSGLPIEKAFLDRLPEKERSVIKKQMLDRDGLVNAASDLPRVLLHGDLVTRNIGIRADADRKAIILIDWELAGEGNPVFDIFQFLGHELREVSDHLELVEHYYDRYRSYGGQMDTSLWRYCCSVGVAHYGVTFFPFFAEQFVKDQPDKASEIVDRWTERVMRSIHDLRL